MGDSTDIDITLVHRFLENEYIPFLHNVIEILRKKGEIEKLDGEYSFQGIHIQLVDNMYITKSLMTYINGKEITVIYNSANNFVFSSNGVNSELLEATYVNIESIIQSMIDENDANVKH